EVVRMRSDRGGMVGMLPKRPRGISRVDDPREMSNILCYFRTGSTLAEVSLRYGLLEPACPLAQSPDVRPFFPPYLRREQEDRLHLRRKGGGAEIALWG